MIQPKFLSLLGVLLISLPAARADANFDLSGPPLQVRVTRDGKTLPLSQVPNLEAGDRLWLHPDFPDQQTARYLLVASFLQGSTNPPPENWFTRAETWNQKVRQEGLYVTVPANAQQVLLFLAPETTGAFSTLRNNVRARPGAFVRASQDLNQASLDRSRLDTYLNAVARIPDPQGAAFKEEIKMLARSLNIKVDDDCFKKPPAQQLTCLTQNQGGLVLDDGHTQSMVAAITSGASADLIGQLSATPLGGAGAYSPYVGAIVDVVRIMDGIHTAQYQYIPALAEMDQQQLQLKLNNPPSFSNPKSVLTVGLPAVQAPQLPPLRAVDPDQIYCVETPSLLLPAEGAPLVYSTSLAHDFVLHVAGKSGAGIDLPAHADPSRGGFVVDTHSVQLASMTPEAIGTLKGFWGFQPFDGPSFHLESSHTVKWNLPDADKSALIVGREDTVHLEAGDAACVDGVSAKDGQGKPLHATYKMIKPDRLEVKLALDGVSPGPVTLELKQAGMTAPDHLQVEAYPEAAHLAGFTIHAGDQEGQLSGTRLDQVSGFQMKGMKFVPGALKRAGDKDELTLAAAAPVSELQAGEALVAHVALKDGREMQLPVTPQGPRPRVTLISKNAVPDQTAAPSPIRLADTDELPQDGTLTFVLQAEVPPRWARGEKIEVATDDDSVHATLTMEDGSLTLQDAKTVLARVKPLTSFGPSAFGPLRFRPVDASGAQGEWQPLGNLVRIPTLKEVHCPASPDKQCTLFGSNLFLLDSVAASADFHAPVTVPVGFASGTLQVPRPVGTVLYLKLRDDPKEVNSVALPVLPE